MHSRLRVGASLALVVVALLLSACASAPAVFRYSETQVQRVWPAEPETPRLVYLGQIIGEQNFEEAEGTKKNVLVQALKWIVGLGFGRHQPVVLQRPQSGVVGDNGRIYITDVSRQAVFVFDRTTGKLHVWDGAERNRGFVAPIGIALGAQGQVLIADAELGYIARLSAEGEPLGYFGKGAVQRPTGIARDPDSGRIYVSDTHEHNIKIFGDEGELLDVIGERGDGPRQFNSPTHLSFRHGQLYVTDAMNSRIQILTPDGEFIQQFGRRGLFVGDMPHPKGVASDSEGNVYVIESYFDHLLVYNAQGEFLLPIGGSGHQVGQFYLPAGVWVDASDRIYVADMFNGRVVVFQYLAVGPPG